MTNTTSSSIGKLQHIIPLIIVLLPFGIILYQMLSLTGGNMSYSLDDVYIHLEIANNIFHGNYGININEPSAPASSILYPYMLAPFAALKWSWFEVAPLIINLLFAVGLAYVIDRIFRDIEPFQRALINFLILFSLNIYGQILNGMEHTIHIFLVAVILIPFIGAGNDKNDLKVTTWWMLAVVALPLVRYEGVAISGAVICYLFFSNHRKPAFILAALCSITVLSFSAFIYSKGLGVMPSSVIAKTSIGSVSGVFGTLIWQLKAYGYLIVFPLFCIYFAVKDGEIKWALVIAVVTFLHFFFGKYGFGRYEGYYIMFMVLITFRILTRYKYMPVVSALNLPIFFSVLVGWTINTPLGAANVYYQQGQMAKVVTLLDAPVAVNDLGFVAFMSDHYVLDLFGLGSKEVLTLRLTKGDDYHWIDKMMNKKGVDYAIVYENWFTIPPSWIKVADMKLMQKKITPAESIVTYFAVDEAAAQKMRDAIKAYEKDNQSPYVRLRYF